MNNLAVQSRKGTLVRMCDERVRILQDQFNVSMNHVQAMSILISTLHHGKSHAIDQKTFAKYTERTTFERPLTSGVAYVVRVLHPEREKCEKQQGWTIRMMDTIEKNPVHKGDHVPEKLEPSPIQEEYAPVIFAQDTVAHVVSLDVLSGKEDRDNVLRARESRKGVLTAPFRLLKKNRLGVILTFAVYKSDLPTNAIPKERIQGTDGYLGGIFDIESLVVEKLLQQLASEHTILVNVYDRTNHSHLIIHAIMKRLATIEDEFNEMKKLKKMVEVADVAKSEVLDHAKIESGKLGLEEVPFELRQILDDVLSLFSGKCQEKGVELAVYISDRVPDMVIGDPGRFSTNHHQSHGKFYKMEDTGKGIPQEAQSRIFTPFVQVGPSISRRQEGIGIGLSISKCLVNIMNGEIGFMSIPKIGSTFTFTIVFTNDLKSQKLDQSSKMAFSPEFQGMRAWVVDSRPVRAKMSTYHV
ncbi:Histidine kinase 3 [Linum perenne]